LSAESHSAALGRYPAGRTIAKTGEYSCFLELLPYLEQSSLYSAFDRTRAWNDPRGNLNIANTNLRILRCPGAITKFDGKTDYGGIAGSLLPGMFDAATGLENGIMVEIGLGRPAAVRPGEVTDGQSHTLIAGEACDRPETLGGRWISGYSTISHNNGSINEAKGGDLHSHHPQGANAAFADGRVQFLSQSTAEPVLGAICTRSGGETVDAL
jgi:prepilin-type processing-associated H-X9-DG protein